MRIYKYRLPPTGEAITLDMPVGTEILHVHAQNDAACLWAAVNPENTRTEKRSFLVICTGADIKMYFKAKFLGTVHLERYGLVLHVFETTTNESEALVGDKQS